MEKIYKKHPEIRPPPKPESDEEPEEPKVDIKFVSEEMLEQWNGQRITDIIQLPPDIPVPENRPNRKTINPIKHGFSIKEPN